MIPLRGACVLAAFSLVGCAGKPIDERAIAAAGQARFGPAASGLARQMPKDRGDSDFLLARMRVLSMALAEGVPASAEVVANEAYDMLRTQGLNADRELASVVLTESVRIWKGEPFEQAMSYHMIALQKAMVGDWENARAASQASLFLLKDFSQSKEGGANGGGNTRRDMTPHELAEIAARQEQRKAGAGDRFLEQGFLPTETDFALGHVMNALANRALAREGEMRESLAKASVANPALSGLCDTIATGTFDTVFVVDYGLGPAKIAYGPDNAITKWEPRYLGDWGDARTGGRGDLRVSLAGPGVASSASSEPAVANVNAMARSHRWNNLEGVRVLKSSLGEAMLVGGVLVASESKDKEAKWVGAGVALAGLLMKAGAQADTRAMEFFPQRVFVVPVNLPEGSSTVSFQVGDDANSRVVVTGLSPPDARDRLQLKYVRMPFGQAQQWQMSERVLYASDAYTASVPGDTLPYIFGGACVRTPSLPVLQHYQAAGNLLGLSLVDLENLYREEQITLRVEDLRGVPSKHVLEDGTSLVAPIAGSMGFQRLFCAPHASYKPRSEALKQAVEQERARGREPASAGSTEP